MSRWLAIVSVTMALLAPAPARTRPRYGGTLRVETRSDPLKCPDGTACRLLFDTLTQVNENGDLTPALAVSWEAESANHRWTFHLRSGVHFHDGSLLTSDSVVQSLAMACQNCGWRARAAADTIIITSDMPLANLPAELARSAYAVTRKDGSGNPDGTGPFRFVANSNGILFLAANDDSWQGRPFVDAVEIYGNRPIREQWLDFTVGKADLVEVPPEFLRQAQQQHMPLLVSSRPVDLLALTLSDKQIPDVHLRESIALAVDRAALFNVIFQKQGEITASLLPNALSGYAFLFPTAANPNRSRELRGAQSIPLRLSVDSSNSVLQLVAERLALNLRDGGWNVRVVAQATNPNAELNLRLVHLEAAAATSTLRELMQEFGTTAGDGPARAALSAQHQARKVNGLSSRAERSGAEGSAVPLEWQDSADPAALYRAERGFLESHTVVPLLYLPRAYGLSARVHSLFLAPDGKPILANATLEDIR